MWNIAGLLGNILIFYSWIVYLMILYRLTIINKYLLIVCTALICVNVNIRMYNFDDVQCTVIPSVAYGFVTGMNLQLC